jgi:hypothetical protein
LNLLPVRQEFLGVSKQRAVTTEAVVYSEVRGLACITVSKPLPERGAERALIRPALQVATLLPDDIAGVIEQYPFLRERVQTYARLRQEAEEMVSGGARVKDVLDKLASAARQVQKINEAEGHGDGHDARTDTGLTVARQVRCRRSPPRARALPGPH